MTRVVVATGYGGPEVLALQAVQLPRSERGQVATIAGFGRAAELGVAALTGADGGEAIRAAAGPKLVEMAAAGELDVFVDKVFPLDKAADAHRYLQKGHARGKVVLLP